MRRTRSTSTAAALSGELDSYRRAVAVLSAAFEKVARGDLEMRIAPLEGPPELALLRDDVNLSLDVMDAFVRESGASLTAAAQGRFHRQFLVRGMPGTFRDGAQRINTACDTMQEGALALADQDATRQLMVDKASEVSVHVAAASTELGASAQILAASAQSGVDEASCLKRNPSSLPANSPSTVTSPLSFTSATRASFCFNRRSRTDVRRSTNRCVRAA